jgi:hypothetical protein
MHFKVNAAEDGGTYYVSSVELGNETYTPPSTIDNVLEVYNFIQPIITALPVLIISASGTRYEETFTNSVMLSAELEDEDNTLRVDYYNVGDLNLFQKVYNKLATDKMIANLEFDLKIGGGGSGGDPDLGEPLTRIEAWLKKILDAVSGGN